jgi:hypothetical protein
MAFRSNDCICKGQHAGRAHLFRSPQTHGRCKLDADDNDDDDDGRCGMVQYRKRPVPAATYSAGQMDAARDQVPLAAAVNSRKKQYASTDDSDRAPRV